MRSNEWIMGKRPWLHFTKTTTFYFIFWSRTEQVARKKLLCQQFSCSFVYFDQKICFLKKLILQKQKEFFWGCGNKKGQQEVMRSNYDVEKKSLQHSPEQKICIRNFIIKKFVFVTKCVAFMYACGRVCF